ncbi:phasin family protein [Synechococcus sp. PCC 7336]|uniref:phasin family protein n=1 Tax=Synechococcus sp. PCC 7336 TaxID=195250 RepID=UPI00036A3876|nr:phasin family protein [Synechococcus sp. PCC 7336]
MDNSSLLRQMLLMGIGTSSLVIEQISKAADDLAQSGSIDPAAAKQVVEKVMTQLKTEQGNLEAQLQRQIRNVMQDLGVPRQAEMDELRGRLDRLERQVRSLEDKLYR